MKKIIFSTIGIIISALLTSGTALAHGMMDDTTNGSSQLTQGRNDHTAQEEAEGKAIWERFRVKEFECEDLSEGDFGALGEYFMGQMAGEQHAAMNSMMLEMMGGEGEVQMHIAMGKRMSGCEPEAPLPQTILNSSTLPMMMQMMMDGGMMGSGGSAMMGNLTNNPISRLSWGSGWVFTILFLVLLVLAIVALVKWLMNQSRHEAKSKSALGILKERYAKGEIDKKEFEERKKDLI